MSPRSLAVTVCHSALLALLWPRAIPLLPEHSLYVVVLEGNKLNPNSLTPLITNQDIRAFIWTLPLAHKGAKIF